MRWLGAALASALVVAAVAVAPAAAGTDRAGEHDPG